MTGINLNLPIWYKLASLRFFEKNEHHVTRLCRDNVLLLVYEGVLRFSEDGIQKEVRAGEYYVQKKDGFQAGELASDAPKYLYVHFDAEWAESPDAFPAHGTFDFSSLADLITKIDLASHQNDLYAEQQHLFLTLLLRLRSKESRSSFAQRFSEYIEKNYKTISSLSDICEAFHYSKNYIIQIFNKEFGVSPVQYVNKIKIERAMYLLETTSKPITDIAVECGYSDYPYFYKRFTQKTGVSPRNWRKQIQENPLHR